MKITDIKAGDKIVLDNGFTCRGPGPAEVKQDRVGLYFECSGIKHTHEQGSDDAVDPARLTEKHYLDGQECDDGGLAGIRPLAPDAAA